MDNKELIKKIEIKMLDAKRHFGTFKLHMEQAEKLIKAGFESNPVNKVYLQNAENILASFVSNGSVREIMRLMQGKGEK